MATCVLMMTSRIQRSEKVMTKERKIVKTMVMYRNLRKTERIVWILLLACLFFLFQWGIDIEYEHINTVSLSVLHTVTVVASIVLGVLQVSVIEKIHELEKEIYGGK